MTTRPYRLKFVLMKKLIGAAGLITILLLTVLPLTGCFLIEQKTASLRTDIPEVAAYVEIFNASQSNYRIELVYSDTPADYNSLVQNGAPDIVISENLASNSIIKAFAPLDKMIEEGAFDPSVVYPNLYRLGTREDIPYLLPVSFNIPAVIFREDKLSDYGTIITPQQLKTEAGSFNEQSSARYPVMGFSPSWTADFMLSTTFIFGTGFAETGDGSLLWNDVKLGEAVDFMRDWTENVNSGWAKEEDFTLTYCYDPGYKLLNAGRIGFYYTSLRDFYTIPAEERATLDYRWLGNESSIPVCEDIVFIGIPKQSRKKETAEAFLLWLLSPDTQKNLLESSHFKRMRGFGIAGGLSSLHSINQLIFPAHYKRLIGAVPPPESLNFPKTLPADWQRIRSDVIIPWLSKQNTEAPPEETLAESLKVWTLQEKKK